VNDVRWDDAALDDLLMDPAGPVGQMLAEMSARIVTVAVAVVPVRDPATRDRRKRAGRDSTARPPGFTRASITPHGPVRGIFNLYAGANAAADPAIFLELPADQMNRKYPFLTTGLDSLTL
jgi:hypothetical protein